MTRAQVLNILTQMTVRARQIFLWCKRAGPSRFKLKCPRIEAHKTRHRTSSAPLRTYVRAFAGVAQ